MIDVKTRKDPHVFFSLKAIMAHRFASPPRNLRYRHHVWFILVIERFLASHLLETLESIEAL